MGSVCAGKVRDNRQQSLAKRSLAVAGRPGFESVPFASIARRKSHRLETCLTFVKPPVSRLFSIRQTL
jgi:hypothetical protein